MSQNRTYQPSALPDGAIPGASFHAVYPAGFQLITKINQHADYFVQIFKFEFKSFVCVLVLDFQPIVTKTCHEHTAVIHV